MSELLAKVSGGESGILETDLNIKPKRGVMTIFCIIKADHQG